MEEFQIQSGELLFNSKQKGQVSAAHSRSKIKNAKELFCNTFTYEAKNVNEKPLGNLYMVGEIELPTKSKQHNSSYLINLIASIVKREYYANPKRSPLESMESALNKANFALSDFAENGNVDWMHHLHFIIAAIAGDTLHLTQTGYAKSLLLRDQEITDIGKTLPSKEKTLNPLKTFLHVASGTIEPNDKIIFATPELFNILSLEKLRRIIVLGDIEGNIKEIQKLIEENDSTSALGVIMLETPKNEATAIIKQGIEKVILGEEQRLSLKDIINEEQEETTETFEEEPQEQETPREPSAIFFKTIKELGGKSYNFVKRYSIPALKSLKEKTIKLTKKAKSKLNKEQLDIETSSESTEEIQDNQEPAEKRNYFKNIIEKAKDTPQKAKIFISLFAAIIIIFFISTYISSRNKQKSEMEKKVAIEKIIDNAQTKITEAENSLPANNYDITNAVLAEANALIEKIKTEDAETYAQVIDDFTKQTNSIYNKLNKITIIEEAENIGSVLADAQKCAKIENLFYCYGLSQNSLYKLDIDNGKMTMMDLGIQNSEQFEAITSVDKQLILLTKHPSLVIYNTETSISNMLDLNIDDPIISMASYMKYLYLLSSKNNIIKVSGIFNGSSATSNWIKDNFEQDKFANTISIDGDVYIANTDGSISKYTQGSFIENIEIPLSTKMNSPDIYTSTDLENLYLLDKTTQKIVIADKQGNLIQQIFINGLDNIKNIFVDNNNVIYILNKDKLYKINF